MSRRLRCGLAGFVAMALVVGATSAAWVNATATPASADSPALVPVMPGGASHPWSYLETEAMSLLANRGVPTDLPEQSTRGLVRSYVFLQLIALIGKANAHETLSPQQRSALDYLEQQVRTERHAAALNAYAKYWNFATNEQSCDPGSGPSYSDGSSGMGGAACVFNQMFGHNPTALQYNAVGFSEAMQAFREPEAARVFLDTTQGLSFWNALPVLPTSNPDDVVTQEYLQQIIQDELTQVGKELLQDIAGTLVDLATSANAALDFGLAAGALAVILTSGVWNIINAQNTGSALQQVASSNPVIQDSDLSAIAAGKGTEELFFVVMGATMPVGTALPPSAADPLPSNDVNGQFPCSWYHDAAFTVNGTGHTGCFGYRFAADPDSIDARYPAGSTPPAQTANDPQFLLKQHYTGNLNGSPFLSPTLQRGGATLAPWVAGDRLGAGLLHDSSSARNVEADASSIHYVEGATTWDTKAADGQMEGYSSYIHHGAVVTQFANFENPGISSPDPNTWKYDQGIRYVDWNGNWWVAWYQDGKFRHVKVAEPVGPLQPGNQSLDMGQGPCNENPVTPTPGRGTISVGGPDCLFAYNADSNRLNEGDVVLSNGAIRVVRAGVKCIHWDQDNWSLFSDGWGVAAVSTCGQGNGSPRFARALLLQPGVSTNWSALAANGILQNLLSFNSNDFELGAIDNHAMEFVRGNTLANCDTSPGASETTTTAGCFVSPNIGYKARTSSNTTENWSATLAYPPQLTATAASGYDRHTFTGNVATFASGDPNAALAHFSAQVNWGDGNTSVGTVTANGAGGYDVNASHLYGEPNLYTMTVTVTDTTTGASAHNSAAFTAAASPRVTAAAVRPPDANGWYNHSVGVHFTCVGTDNVCPPDQTLQGDGTAVSSTAQTGSSPDHAISSTSNVVTVKIDTQAPTIDTATFSVDATSPTGANVDLGPVASDVLSGVQSVTCTPRATQTIFPIGDTQENCHAQDVAGNDSDVLPLTVHVWSATEQGDNLVAEAGAAVPAGNALINNAKAIQTAIKKDNPSTACTNLGKFANTLRGQTPTPVDASEAAALDQHVGNLAGTLGGCAFQAATTTTVAYSNPAAPAAPRTGEAVTLTATVTQGAAAVPAGKVQFFVNGAALGTPVAVSTAGIASKTTTTLLPAGIPPAVTATYIGTVIYSPSAAPALPVPVALADTTTWLTVTPGQPAGGYVYGGKPLTFKAEVDVNVPGAGTPTGFMLFYADSLLLGSAPVSQRKAALTVTSPLSPGFHFVNATYIGTGALNASFSTNNLSSANTRAILIAKAPTKTKMTVPETSTFPSLAAVTAKVTVGGGSSAAPDGRVQFSVDGQSVGSSVAVDSDGNASANLPGPVIGRRTILATFLGNDNVGSSSGKITQTVESAPTVVTVTASPATVAPGVGVTLRATLTNPYPQTPIGTVQFYEGATRLASTKLSNGVATATVKFAGVGTHQVRVGFHGNPPNLGGGSSPTVDVVVGTNVNGNDDFVYAEGISGTSGSTAGSNATATSEAGEPAAASGPNKSVWYRWTAPETGIVMFDTCADGSFDTMLAAYTGNAVNALTRVTGNDDSCGVRSRIRFPVTASQRYLIQVDGYSGASGPFTLTWSMPEPPPNDHFAAATEIGGSAGSIEGTLLNASAEPGDPGAFGTGAQNSVWYAWTAPVSGLVTLDTCSGLSSVDSDIGVFTGSAVATLAPVASAAEGCDNGGLARLTFPADAGTTYRVVVDSPGSEGDDVAFTLSWSTRENDRYVLPVGMEGGDGSIRGTTVGMTPYTGEEEGEAPWEPASCAVECSPAEGPNTTAWYDWQAPSDGSVTIDTCTDTDFDTLLAVYATQPDFSLSRTAESNDAAGCGDGTQSRVTFPTTKGTHYEVQVDSRDGGTTGHFRLSWSFDPANDEFADAIEVSGASGTRSGSIDGASAEPQEPRPCNGGEGCGWNVDGPSHTVWYRWTAPEAGTVTFDTCSATSADTMLASYRADDPPALSTLTRVAENNDGCGFRSKITFPVDEDEEFFLQVDGERNQVGTFTLRWALTPANDAFAAAREITGPSGSIDGSNVYAGNEPNEPATCVDCEGTWDGPRKTMWYSWTAPSSGTATIDTCTNEAFDTMLAVYTGGAIDSLTRIANDDGGCGFLTSRVTFAATAGTTYMIQVDGWVGRNGPFTLSWNLT